jgi:hypothetical protein
MYYLSVLGIFKNEGHIINEWIEHHLREGVDHFYLIDNGSNDGYNITKYNKYVDLVIDPTKHSQSKLYNKYYLNKVKRETEWLMVIDLDEFMYSTNGFHTITEFLSQLRPTINQVSVPNKIFGSSGHVYQPDSVIKNMVYRFCYNTPAKVAIKSITKTKYIKMIDIHRCLTYDNRTLSNNRLHSFGNKITDDISEDILKNSFLHLNHYVVQSFEWYRTVKMTRGDVLYQTKDSNYRTLDFFNVHNEQAIHYDDELKYKTYDFDMVINHKLPDIKLYGSGKYIDITNINFNEDIAKYLDHLGNYYIIRINNRLYVFEIN